MTPVSSIWRSLVAVYVIAAGLLGCAQTPSAPEAPAPAAAQVEVEKVEAAKAPVATESDPLASLPKLDLSEELLYDYMLAEVAAQRGDVAFAARAYADLAKRTRDPRIARRAFEVAYSARAADQAIEALKIWLEAQPGSFEALRRLASLLISANRIEEAEPYLQRILADGVNREEGFLQMNRLLAGNPDRGVNLRVVQGLAKPYPDMPESYFAIAQAAVNADQSELALSEIRIARKLRPAWELAALFEAQVLQKSVGNAAARQCLESFLSAYPKSRDVRLNYARVLVADKAYPEARLEFENLLKEYPDNTEVVFAVAILSIQLEDYAGAEANLKRLLDLNYRDQDMVRLYLGQIAEEQKRYADAIDWYSKITGGDHYLSARIREAQARAKGGDLAGAREFLHKVETQTNQQRVQLILAEAHLLRDENQVKEAFDIVGKGLDTLPNDTDLLYEYAMLGERLDRMDVLESSLRKLMRIKPDHAHAYNALGYSLADRNERLSEAQELIQKALILAPDDVFIMDSMGWVLYRQGNNEEAIKYLRRAYAGRQDAEIAAHLGEVLWVSGNKAEARKIWEDAAAKTPTNESLVKTIQRFKE